ncbi:MAG TPA: NAD(P)/FAD-dependent oxidoreductase [Mycobacterium sp.]|nr:NAD(P)/FAD-dependent oxidoreductase [Mycobacterium sp.]HME79701.1 NAD(P)/FAD-dependent oxidoreductase [Mycobacterium sp.]
MRRSPRIVIVGAGMSGLCQAILLDRAGFTDVNILEKDDRPGGTWRDNRYPGLTCDVPSHLYQYSFDLNPSWSRLFSPGPEIQDYFVDSARRHNIERMIRYHTEVVDAHHNGLRWRLTTNDGENLDADFVVLATGFLHRPRVPDIAGMSDFAGQLVHSARWSDDISVAGKRIAVVGNGSTGVQLISAVAGVAAHATLFQRTPQWVARMPNPSIPPAARALLSRSRLLNRAVLRTEYKTFEIFSVGLTQPGLRRRVVNRVCERNLASVADPALRAKLTPDYRPGCKRLVIHPDFYAKVQRPDVSLETAAIDRFEKRGIRTVDGRLHAADIVVMATGFNAHDYVRPATVRTHDGHTLSNAWSAGPRAYKSVAIQGMPNLFMLLGPHSPIGNFSLVQVAETQAAYVLKWITRWAAGEYDTLRPTAAAIDAYLEHIRRGLPGTVWTTGCSSWYLGTDGLPELWPYHPHEYLRLLKKPDDHSYVMESGVVGRRDSTLRPMR